MPYGLRVADEVTLEVFGGKLRVKDSGLDVSKLAEAATQTASASFVATHNNRPVLLLGADSSSHQSNTVTPIQAGIRVGQLLTVILVSNPSSQYVIINDSGNTQLNGRWYVGASGVGLGSWLKVCWDGSVWKEVGRGPGGISASGTVTHAEGRGTNASGSYAHAEGSLNIASGDMGSHAEGSSCTASGLSAHAEGGSCVASGDRSHAQGSTCTASGNRAHAEGGATTADGDYSHAQGLYAKASRYGEYAQASGRFAADGDAQFTRSILRNVTWDTSWKELFLDGASARWTLDDEFSYACMITIAARMNTGGAQCAHFTRRLTIERTNGTVTLRSGPAYVYGDHNPNGDYSIRITADDINKSLKLEVKHDDGISAKDVRWVSVIEAVEIECMQAAPPP